MERFCDKCGSLVSGEGKFCPVCGAVIEGAVSNGSVNLNKSGDMPAASGAVPSAPTPTNNTYAGSSNVTNNPVPVYTQNYNNTGVQNTQPEMTVGNWVLTLFLSGLGIIGLILLFVWAFGDGTHTAKKNYARAMLIWQAIAVGLVILFYVGLFACTAAFVGSEDWNEIFRSANYYGAFGIFNFR